MCFETLAEAEGYRLEKLATIRQFGQSTFLTDSERAEFAAAKLRLSERGFTVTQAVDFFLSQFRQKESRPMGEVMDQMITEKTQAKRRLRYVRQLGYDIAGFIAGRRETLCRDVTPAQIHEFLHGNNWAPKTMEGKFISLQTFFSYALARGWCDENPCAKVERVSVDYETPGILTVEQCERLMHAAQWQSLCAYLALALFAGVRPEEIKRLSWKAIEGGVLRIESEHSKVRQRRLVTLSANCLEWLKLGGELPPVNWQDRLNEVRKLAGFEYSIRSKVKGRKTKYCPGEMWPHNCLRHSFVSYSLPIHGVSETARQAGNSEEKVHHNYKALVTREQAERFWAILPAPNLVHHQSNEKTGNA